jgi:hypothetical protein
MPAVGKKLHHFVPRFYLKAWAKNGQIHCLQDGEIFRTNVKNVAAENHFYRLRALSKDDITFIREAAINDSPERLKPLHEDLLRRFATPHAAKAHYENLGTLPPDQLAAINRDIAEANKNFHMTIEESFEPYIESLRRGDLTFLSNDKDTVLFYRGLAVQYMRTNHRRRIELMMAPESKVFYERTANVLTHTFAVNIGYSLFNDHPKLKLVVIENPSDVPFIIADQPVINIAAKLKDTGAPDKFEAYYPVSPTRALLILEPDSEFLPKNLAVSAMEAHFWNLRIASRAYRQVFAQSTKELEMVKADMPAFASCH